jgi:hypothetical protein
MYEVENKTKFSILIIPVYSIYREIRNESLWDIQNLNFNVIVDDIFNK